MAESLFWGTLNLISIFLGIGVIFSLVNFSDKMSNLAKKVCGVIALVVIFYWMITVPWVDRYYFLNSSKVDSSVELIEIKHTENQENRIIELERELKTSKDDIKNLRDHYYWFWQFIMYASIYFICSKMFGKVVKTEMSQTD